jgi:D-arabinose 1-dehydrogenase-like Zn-dependent alcohol dehydrogenase
MGIDITVFKGSKDGIVQATTHSELPTGNQILIKITHSGICGTDEHYKETDMVLGHEGVGTVQELGEDVKGFKVGDLVGWGYTHVTCGTCDQCLLGKLTWPPRTILAEFFETRTRPILPVPGVVRHFCVMFKFIFLNLLCMNSYGASNLHQGSFGSHAIWDASFVFHVPEGLAPDFAAPLMCGG